MSGPFVLSLFHAWFGIQVLLGLSDFLLRFSFDFLPFTLELLSGISSCCSDGAADPTFHLLAGTLQAVFDAFRRQILFVRHLRLPLI